MTDTPSFEDLTPEQQEQVRQAAIEQQFDNPPILTIRYNLRSVQLATGDPALWMRLETPAAVMRLVWGREDALAFGRAIKKQVETGPQLVAAPSGLLVPGR